MNLEEVPEYLRVVYEKECPICCITQKILSKASNFPEYETEIYLQCQCGEYLEFILPVN